MQVSISYGFSLVPVGSIFIYEGVRYRKISQGEVECLCCDDGPRGLSEYSMYPFSYVTLPEEFITIPECSV